MQTIGTDIVEPWWNQWLMLILFFLKKNPDFTMTFYLLLVEWLLWSPYFNLFDHSKHFTDIQSHWHISDGS